MLTKNGISPTVSTTWLWISLVAFILLYGMLGTVDLILMLRYSRKQLPPQRTEADDRHTDTGRPVLRAHDESRPVLVHRHRDLVDRFLHPRGVRLRRRHAAPARSAATSAGRRAAINTIGPLWDGNEVWLIVAGAAMFAAFPGWYATMFSGMYLAMVLLLAALIVRGVAFEYRGKRDAASLAAYLGRAADRRQRAGPAADRRRPRRPAARAADQLQPGLTPAPSGTCCSPTPCSPASPWS